MSIKNRYDFMVLLEAKYSNPNGDPDLENFPRQDFETNLGYITDIALKRRVRDYVLDKYNGESGKNIIIRAINNVNEDIFKIVEKAKKDGKTNQEVACEEYWDVRTFGGVLSSGKNAGQINGPVQLSFGKSIDEIEIYNATISAPQRYGENLNSLAEFDKAYNDKNDNDRRTLGKKAFIPYGLYLFTGTISANLAEKTGFSEDDLSLLLEALLQSYNNCNTASKQGVSVLSPVIIFKHIGSENSGEKDRENEARLGCAPAYKLFNTVHINRKEDVDFPRDFTDYKISIDTTKIPKSVELGFKINPFEPVSWNPTEDDFIEIIK